MKKGLLILLCLPMIGYGQQTYVPDDNFEQKLINLGYDNTLDNFVLTANISTIGSLSISNNYINDLTGIEDFNSLVTLDCSSNNLFSLDLSSLNNLLNLDCSYNDLITLIVNQEVKTLWCMSNQISTLDLSNNYNLSWLRCNANNLTSLDLRNGNNHNLIIWEEENLTSCYFVSLFNSNLICIDVDNPSFSTNHWEGFYDIQTNFSYDCLLNSTNQILSNKILTKITNVLGQETKETKNKPLFYIYDDGTVEKRIIIE